MMIQKLREIIRKYVSQFWNTVKKIKSVLMKIKIFKNWMKVSLEGDKIDFQEVPQEPDIRRIKFVGWGIIVFFFGGFALWSVLANLDSAAVAPGQVIVSSERKTIQHLEGGIVKRIYVKEGDSVKRGDLLVQLDEVQAQEKIDAFKDQLNLLQTTEARLIAERDGAEQITFPERIMKQINDPKVQKEIATQQLTFDTNKEEKVDLIEILNKKILQSKDELESYKAQYNSELQQVALIGKEIKTMEGLDEKGLILKSRLYALQREEARLLGNRKDHEAKIAQTTQHIKETETEIIHKTEQQKQEIFKLLYETKKDIPKVIEELSAARDVLKRLSITAPQDGVIMDMKVHTVGGVVRPGEPIMDLVPSSDNMIIKARVHPLDIDLVRVGLVARVNLMAFKTRYTGRLNGKVTEVSGDSFRDPKTGENYYEVLVVVDPNELEKVKGLYLYPGMPVQVMIITHKRTPLQYLLSPIRDSLDRAFREK